MSKLKEETGILIKGIINTALDSTRVNGKKSLETASNPFKGPNARPNKARLRKEMLKLRENLTKTIRVPAQVSSDENQKGIGDDTKPFVPETDKVSLRRRKARKRFFNSIDDIG